jgi:hypothetical protein
MKLCIIIWTANWNFFRLWLMNYYHWLTCQQGGYDVSKQESTSWKVGWTSKKVPVTKDWFNLHTEPCTSIIDCALSHTFCTLNFIVLKRRYVWHRRMNVLYRRQHNFWDVICIRCLSCVCIVWLILQGRANRMAASDGHQFIYWQNVFFSGNEQKKLSLNAIHPDVLLDTK